MKKILASLAAAVLVLCGVMGTVPAYAALGESGSQYLEEVDPDSTNSDTLPTTIKQIINVILGVIGLICVVVIIIGGINFTTSQGDAGKVKKARDTILYGIVGLVVALLAFAIVNFVLGNIFG